MADSPSDSLSRRTAVRAMLLEHDAGSMHGSLGGLLRGAAVCLALGIVLAILFALAPGTSAIGFKWWFLIYVLVVVALLFWYDRRPLTQSLAEARREAGAGLPHVESADAGGGGSPLSSRLLSWGPGPLVAGLRGVRGRRNPREIKAFERASVLVLDLAKVDGGVPLKELLHPPEDMQAFGHAVDWLESNDWIGKSTDGNSLWLSSTGRRKLVSRNLAPKPGEFM